MGGLFLNADRKIEKESLEDYETYIITFDTSGKFLKEVMELISGDDKVLSQTIAKCLSFYRMCKEIENKGGKIRFKLDGTQYEMKLP